MATGGASQVLERLMNGSGMSPEDWDEAFEASEQDPYADQAARQRPAVPREQRQASRSAPVGQQSQSRAGRSTRTVSAMRLREVGPHLAETVKNLTVNQLFAIIIWLLAVWTTKNCVDALTMTTPLPTVFKWLLAALAQAFFTYMESPLWQGEVEPLNVFVALIDEAANAGGLFFAVVNLGTMPFVLAVARLGEKACVPAANVVCAPPIEQVTINPWVALLVALVFGLALMAGPEVIWKRHLKAAYAKGR